MPIDYYIGQWKHTHTSYQALTTVLPKARLDSKTGGWFKIPMMACLQDCKGLFLYQSEVFMWSLGGTKREIIYIWHTSQ